MKESSKQSVSNAPEEEAKEPSERLSDSDDDDSRLSSSAASANMESSVLQRFAIRSQNTNKMRDPVTG